MKDPGDSQSVSLLFNAGAEIRQAADEQIPSLFLQKNMSSLLP